QRDVEAAVAAADGSRQRALDRHGVVAERLHRVLRQPFAVLVTRLAAGVHLEPVDLTLPSVRFLHRGVEDAVRGGPDVRPDAIPFDEGQDRIGRDAELSVLDLYPFPLEWDIQFFEFQGDGLLASALHRVAAAPDPPGGCSDALRSEWAVNLAQRRVF